MDKIFVFDKYTLVIIIFKSAAKHLLCTKPLLYMKSDLPVTNILPFQQQQKAVRWLTFFETYGLIKYGSG